MKNEIDLYNSNKDWYEHLPERKYVILEYLPKCNGKVLSAGTHEFNKHDEICCKNCEYETIDIEKKCEKYGSSFKHTTVDFLDYKPIYKFNHIILFGVMGVPDGLGGYLYPLNNKEDIMLEKVDQILNLNGTLLLGPDVVSIKYYQGDEFKNLDWSKCKSENFWRDWINSNKLIIQKYELINYLVGRNNLCIVLKKIKI